MWALQSLEKDLMARLVWLEIDWQKEIPSINLWLMWWPYDSLYKGSPTVTRGIRDNRSSLAKYLDR